MVCYRVKFTFYLKENTTFVMIDAMKEAYQYSYSRFGITIPRISR